MAQFIPLKKTIDEEKEKLKEQNEKRTKLIGNLEKKLNGNVITYLSNPGDPFSLIEHTDTELLVDLLGSIDRKPDLYLMINSTGGDINAAHKIIQICRDYCDSFYIIVPMIAKSAATLIALGSDTILMGSSSELGPIDAQLISFAPNGQKVVIPARTFKEAYDFLHKEILEKSKPPQLIMPMLMRIDPIMLQNCQNQLEYGVEIAKKCLKTYMWKEDEVIANEIARALNEDYISHGAVINYKEAEGLGLKIKFLPPDSEEWKLIWEYLIRGNSFLNQAQRTKLFESREISLNRKVIIRAIQVPVPQPPPVGRPGTPPFPP